MKTFRIYFPRQSVPEWLLKVEKTKGYRGVSKMPKRVVFKSIIIVFSKGENYVVANALWGSNILVNGAVGCTITGQSPRGNGVIVHFFNLFDALVYKFKG